MILKLHLSPATPMMSVNTLSLGLLQAANDVVVFGQPVQHSSEALALIRAASKHWTRLTTTGARSDVDLKKAFDGTGWRPAQRLPVAQALGKTSLMFLVHPTLSDAELQQTCTATGQVLAQADGKAP